MFEKWQNAVLGHLFPSGLRCLGLKSVRIPASNRLAWQKNLHQSRIPPFFKQGLISILNPIEKLWSKVKATWRKLRVRSPDALDTAIQFAFRGVSPHDCLGWFRLAGYCLF